MGTAWALKTGCTSILLPGFGFEEMTGVVGNQNIAIKLDSSEEGVKDKLDQLYGNLIEEFGLTQKSNSIWERKRDRFIKKVNEIAIQADSSAEQHEV